MKLVREIAKTSDPSGATYRPVHYVAGICSAYFMKEAMEWADKNGSVSGPTVTKGMYQKKNWVPVDLEGVSSVHLHRGGSPRSSGRLDLSDQGFRRHRCIVAGPDEERHDQARESEGHHPSAQG